MTPAELVVAILGNGPHTELAIVGRFISKGYAYDGVRPIVTNALCECMQAKQIEMPTSGVYRLTASAAPMEGGK